MLAYQSLQDLLQAIKGHLVIALLEDERYAFQGTCLAATGFQQAVCELFDVKPWHVHKRTCAEELAQLLRVEGGQQKPADGVEVERLLFNYGDCPLLSRIQRC